MKKTFSLLSLFLILAFPFFPIFVYGQESSTPSLPSYSSSLSSSRFSLDTSSCPVLIDNDSTNQVNSDSVKNADGVDKSAQSFLLTSDSSICGFLARFTFYNDLTLSAHLEADSAGAPDGTPITGTSVDYNATTGTSVNVEFDFASPVTLSAGSYWLVIAGDVDNATSWWGCFTSDCYAGGQFAKHNGSWAYYPVTLYDSYFQVLGSETGGESTSTITISTTDSLNIYLMDLLDALVVGVIIFLIYKLFI